MQSRNRNIDMMRGILMIFMVIGHTASPVTYYIYLFHLAGFMLISGYCLTTRIFNKLELKDFIIKKIKRLYFPYVIANVICILLHNCFIKIHLYSTDKTVYSLEYYNGEITNIYSIKDMIIHISKTLLLLDGENILGAIWFIRVLFYVIICFKIIETAMAKIFKTKTNEIMAGYAVGMLLIGYVLALKDIYLKCNMSSFFTYTFFLWLGTMLRKYENKIENKDLNIILGIIGFLIIYIIGKYTDYCGATGENNYKNVLFTVLLAIAGWFFLKAISYFIGKSELLGKSLEYVGKNTICILFLHFFAFKVVNLWQVKIYGFSLEAVSAFPYLICEQGWWIVYTIVGVLLPLSMYKIIERCLANNVQN